MEEQVKADGAGDYYTEESNFEELVRAGTVSIKAMTLALDYVGRKERQRYPRTIAMDYHEDIDGVAALLLSGIGYTVDKRVLPLGDYQWSSPLGLVIVERKTPADLQDLARLKRQLDKLRVADAEGCFSVLLVDHTTDYSRSGHKWWTDNTLDNLLLAISGKVHVAHCVQGELAHRLDALYRLTQKKEHGFL